MQIHRSLLRKERVKTLQVKTGGKWSKPKKVGWLRVFMLIFGQFEALKLHKSFWQGWLPESYWQVDFENKSLRWVWSQRFAIKDILWKQLPPSGLYLCFKDVHCHAHNWVLLQRWLPCQFSAVSKRCLCPVLASLWSVLLQSPPCLSHSNFCH
jgi:hypothetical protein